MDRTVIVPLYHWLHHPLSSLYSTCAYVDPWSLFILYTVSFKIYKIHVKRLQISSFIHKSLATYITMYVCATGSILKPLCVSA